MRHLGNDDTAFAKGTTLAEIFELDHTERRLLLLGRPGSGKTTQLLNLADVMLRKNAKEPKSPIPVYLPLTAANWARGALLFKKPSEPIDWIAKQISYNYQMPWRRAHKWLTSNPCPIVLLLDGLDEVPDKDKRFECLAALREARKETHAGIVVSCRTADYMNMQDRLNFGLAVEIAPLTAEDIDEYLALANVNMGPLRTAVSHDEMLAELLDTPLMLCVASLAYKDRAVEVGLMQGSKAARQAHLWHSYINAMANRRRNPQYKSTGSPRFPPEKTISYLEFLAQAARRNHRWYFNEAGLTTWWLPDRWRRLLNAMTVCRVIAVGILIGWLSQSLGRPNETSLLASTSVGVGLATASVFWIIFKFTERDPERRGRLAITSMLVFFLGGFVPAGLLGARSTPEGTVLLVLIGGILSALVVFSILWDAADEASEEDHNRRTVLAIFTVRIIWITTCFAVGLLCLSIAHRANILLVKRIVTVDLVACMALIIITVFYVTECVINHYSTRIILAANDFFPFHAESFLSHAEERILLRRIGSRYSFLHLELRDYLVQSAHARR